MKSGIRKISAVSFLIGIMFSSTGEANSNTAGHEVVNNSRVWTYTSVSPDQKATLIWRAPETRVNGDVLGRYDITSYRILYGQDAARLDSAMEVEGTAGLYGISFTIEHLAPGTWYFAIQAKDDDGLLSLPSKIVSKSISS